MIKTLFGFELYFGNIKRRIAKKYLNRTSIKRYIHDETYANMAVGDYVNDCTGLNGIVTELTPNYRKVGNGFILYDIDIATSNTSCSLIHCGVTTAMSRELVEQSFVQFMEDWFFHEDGGVSWYGGLDNVEHKAEIDLAKLKYLTLKAGMHICDDKGMLLPEFRQPNQGLVFT